MLLCMKNGFSTCFSQLTRLHYDAKHSRLVRLLVAGFEGLGVLPAALPQLRLRPAGASAL